jgi:selenocysteine-specific elongation factor
VIALTMADLVDDEWRELASLDVTDHVAGTFLDGAPVVPVSSTTGVGIDALCSALDDLLATTPSARDRERPRLWVDRSFAAKGAGTVVTGTLTDGALRIDDTVVLEPGARSARVRGIQTLGSPVTTIGPGNRVALNISGVAHDEVGRGDAIVTPCRWRPTDRFDARLDVLQSLDHEVSRRGAYLAYIGSREAPVRLRVLGADALAPGGSGPVRLFLPVALPLLPGDRFVLRESGRDETVGGGEVLDVEPIVRASRAAPDRSIERVVAERGWIDVHDLELLTGELVDPMVGHWVTTPELLDAMAARLQAAIEGAGDRGLDLAPLDARERAVVARLDVIVEGGRARGAGAADPFADHPVAAAIRDGGLSPDPPAGVDRATVRELVRRGILVERDQVLFHRDAIDAAAAVAAELLASDPTGFTVAAFRDHTNTTRKYALPILTELDARGITRRRDDRRIPGPRLPS